MYQLSENAGECRAVCVDRGQVRCCLLVAVKTKLKSSLRATEMQSDLSSLCSVSLMILDAKNVSYFALCEHLGLLSVTGFEMEAKKYFSAPLTVVSSEQLAGCVHILPYQPPCNIILFIHKITVDSIVDGYG